MNNAAVACAVILCVGLLSATVPALMAPNDYIIDSVTPEPETTTTEVPFVFLSQPENVITQENNVVSFSVSVNEFDVTYQWQYSRDNGVSWTNAAASGYNSSTFSFVAVSGLNSRLYRCAVTYADTVYYSNSASLSVYSASKGYDYSLDKEGEIIQ